MKNHNQVFSYNIPLALPSMTSIHSSSAAYPGLGGGGSSLSAHTQNSLSPVTSSRGVSRLAQRYISSVSWARLGVSSRLDMLKTSPQEASRKLARQVPEPPQLVPHDAKAQQLSFEPLPNIWARHPISKAEPRHSVKETRFCHLYPQSYPVTTQNLRPQAIGKMINR